MRNTSTNSNLPNLNVALAYQGFVEEPVPSVIFDMVESGVLKKALKIALIAGAFVAGIAAWAAIGQLNASSTDVYATSLTVENQAVSSHNTFAKDLVYPVHVNATDMEHLNSWLSYRVEKQLLLQPLDDIGYALLGANIIPDGLVTSSMVVYENNQSERFSIFTRHSGGNHELSQIKTDSTHGLNLLSWQLKGHQHTMVSELDIKIMRTIFERLQKQ